MPVGDDDAATLKVPSSSRIAPISVAASVSGGITLLKHEPSAHIPWQNTILFFIFGILVSLSFSLVWFVYLCLFDYQGFTFFSYCRCRHRARRNFGTRKPKEVG